jgi:hypothetical protein
VEIDLPEVVGEVTTAFNRYEKALGENDVVTLNSIFRNDPRTIRYGPAEIVDARNDRRLEKRGEIEICSQ